MYESNKKSVGEIVEDVKEDVSKNAKDVKDAVKVAPHAEAPTPAGLKAANSNTAEAAPAPAATDGQEA